MSNSKETNFANRTKDQLSNNEEKNFTKDLRANGSKLIVASDRVATKKLLDQEKFKEKYGPERLELDFFAALINAVKTLNYEAFAALVGDKNLVKHADKLPPALQQRLNIYNPTAVSRNSSLPNVAPAKRQNKPSKLPYSTTTSMHKLTTRKELIEYSTAAITKYAKEEVSVEVCVVNKIPALFIINYCLL